MEQHNYDNRVFYEYTNKCPICNKMISPVEKHIFKNSKINMAFFLLQCPACGKAFVSHYNMTDNEKIISGNKYFKLNYINSYPKIPETKSFSEEIFKRFPNFCKIYNQSYFAEQYDLKDIAGIGYRKALEFLIKDYCIYYNQDEEEKIKKESLSQVITNYISSEKIKKLAKASVWIGNDETHYIRKFEDKDVNDLKKFIDATVAFIDYELISDEAEELINS